MEEEICCGCCDYLIVMCRSPRGGTEMEEICCGCCGYLVVLCRSLRRSLRWRRKSCASPVSILM